MSGTTNFNVRGKLTVTAHGARNLAVKQLIGEMDPYAVFQLKGEKFKTAVANNGHRNPKWEYSFIANLDGDEDALHIKVYNKGNVTDDIICRVDTELPNLDLSGTPQWYSLRDPEDFKKESGEISISLKFEGNGLPVNSKALLSHTARTQPTAAVAPFSPPVQQVQAPQYASQPPQYATQAPQYPPQQQQPTYAQAPVYGQPPQYQQPQQVQYQQAPVYQQPPQPVYQQPQPVYQQPQQVVYQQPPQVQVVYTAPPPTNLFGSIITGANQLAASIQQGVNTMLSTNIYRGKWESTSYHNNHPDVKNAGMDPFQHWKNYGYKEGRIIQLQNGLRGRFDPNGYLALHTDVKAAGMDAFTHYVNHGHAEGRDIVVIPTGAVGKFDGPAYHALHPDVKNAGMDPFTHWKNHGRAEGRRIQVTHNGGHFQGLPAWPEYVRLYPDLIAAGVDGATHYMNHGHAEGRFLVISI